MVERGLDVADTKVRFLHVLPTFAGVDKSVKSPPNGEDKREVSMLANSGVPAPGYLKRSIRNTTRL